MNAMNDSSPLPHERVLELLSRVRDGDEQALELLVTHNVALVKSIVKKYIGRGVEYDDLYQIGCLGLVKAIKNYDPEFNVRFSTYAVPMIAGEIKRFLRDDGMIKVSRSLKELGIRAMAIRERLCRELGQEVGIEDIARELGCESGDVATALESMRPHISIYEPVYDNNNSDNTATLIADRMVYDGNEENEIIDRIFLKEMLGSLESRDRQIIVMRYFQNKTQNQVAEVLGVSQVQVSRLESRILKKLRESYMAG